MLIILKKGVYIHGKILTVFLITVKNTAQRISPRLHYVPEDILVIWFIQTYVRDMSYCKWTLFWLIGDYCCLHLETETTVLFVTKERTIVYDSNTRNASFTHFHPCSCRLVKNNGVCTDATNSSMTSIKRWKWLTMRWELWDNTDMCMWKSTMWAH